jgi:hypothetical protein
MCCCIESCDCNFPSCLGAYQKSVCLCLEGEQVCMKPMCYAEKVQDSLCCVWQKGSCSLVWPYTW